MSISRRGLIAAGLAIAVVGAIGVASTLNAGAAQIAEPTSVTSSAPSTDKAGARGSLLAPPPNLPGGGKAAKGASSAQAEGGANDSATPAVEPVYAPKSLPGFTAPNVRTGKRVKVPALGIEATASKSGVSAKAAGASATAATTLGDQKNYYAQAAQVVDNNGAFANLTIEQPNLQSGDLHSLAEVAVRSADGAHAVEVGWTIDPDVNRKEPARPHLFVYRWVNHVPGCYNGCGWVQLPEAEYKAGSPLTPGETKRFTIQHHNTSWWIGYGNEWIGYFPDSEWDNKFTKASAAQWFGEVAVKNEPSCTDMGNGQPADSPTAASFSRLSLYGGGAVKVITAMDNKELYSIFKDEKEPTTFRYGGKGAC